MLIFIITLACFVYSDQLGFTGISMVYLLLVVGVAYHFSALSTLLVVLTSFLLMNYFFVEPKFTFQIAHFASWASLISFLIVSTVITSLVKRLKLETTKSKQAFTRADFLKRLAEKLSLSDSVEPMINECQNLLQQEFTIPLFIIGDANSVRQELQLTTEQVNAIAWSQENGKPFGTGTNNWSEADFLVIPINRLKSNNPVIFVPKLNLTNNHQTLESLKLAADQIAFAYQHLLQKEKTRIAENQVNEESIKGALLASIAHDMRTPLTSILGAATTLNQSELTLNQTEMHQLTTIISSQAEHLARTTENILSLVRLASVSKETIQMSLVSPEEIIGSLISLYQYQAHSPSFTVKVKQPDLLIIANQDLLMLALNNLIENAIQANKDNTGSSNLIEVVVDRQDDKTIIQVSDSGMGFPEGYDQTQIKKFESTRSKGFGLGLPIVKAVAELHAASIIFQKNSRQGAVISLAFNTPKVNLHDIG